MKQLNIEIPEEYIIDKENSNLDKGIIKYKKKNTLPNSWEEYINSLSPKELIMIDTAIKSNRHKYIALFKLELLRDCYRQGWQPDWDSDSLKYCIIKYLNNQLSTTIRSTNNHFLAFQSQEITTKFLNNF